jgi:hypothetical protein
VNLDLSVLDPVVDQKYPDHTMTNAAQVILQHSARVAAEHAAREQVIVLRKEHLPENSDDSDHAVDESHIAAPIRKLVLTPYDTFVVENRPLVALLVDAVNLAVASGPAKSPETVRFLTALNTVVQGVKAQNSPNSFKVAVPYMLEDNTLGNKARMTFAVKVSYSGSLSDGQITPSEAKLVTGAWDAAKIWQQVTGLMSLRLVDGAVCPTGTSDQSASYDAEIASPNSVSVPVSPSGLSVANAIFVARLNALLDEAWENDGTEPLGAEFTFRNVLSDIAGHWYAFYTGLRSLYTAYTGGTKKYISDEDLETLGGFYEAI